MPSLRAHAPQAGTRPLGAVLDSDFCPFSRAVSEAEDRAVGERKSQPRGFRSREMSRCGAGKLFQARVTSLRGIDGTGRRLDNGGCAQNVSHSALHVPCRRSRSSKASAVTEQDQLQAFHVPDSHVAGHPTERSNA